MFASKDTLLTRPSGYTIARSVRLRSSASGNFSRTLSAGTRTTWTWSTWVKRGVFGAYKSLFTTNDAVNNSTEFFFNTDDTLKFREYAAGSGGYTAELYTTQVFRDPSAWYHIVIVWDSNNGTSGDRVRLYVNGTRVTAFSTASYPTSGRQTFFNSAYLTYIGLNSSSTFDGYLTEVNFIDGQALTPSSFGTTNATTGVWQPAKYTGTYGTNGFYLNFSDNSSNTATTIGKDYSGNGNNWTPNNISVTAGATYDSMLDSPTVSAVSSNYCVMNPLDMGASVVPAYANLRVGTASAIWRTIRSTMQIPTTGKWYSELTVETSSRAITFGISTASQDLANYTGSGSAGWSYYSSTGEKINAGTAVTYGSAWDTAGTVIGLAFDADAGTLVFYKNNTSQGTAYSGLTAGNYFISASPNNCNVDINFGQRPFSYTPPTGFVALNTYNLPASTITNGAGYMAATTYTGTGASLTVANTVGSASFQPDWVWVKGRSGATDHALYDSVRGTTKDLVSNSTAAETTQTTGLTAFGSTGVTVGALAKMNTSAATYVAWQWLAGGSSSSNTNGSITSTVSVGATQGFSVVTYTGTGANGASVGHGLGVTPAMVIMKTRTAVDGWVTYHQSIPSPTSNYLVLNTTAATATASGFCTPSSSTITFTTSYGGTNGSGVNLVAYCFSAVAGYSAFGSYTGNGSTDGPFVYTGFRPRYVLTKRTDSTSNWYIQDTSRSTYNVQKAVLAAESAIAETADGGLDFLSNGFKLRNTDSSENASGGTYIYACFAENPFKNSLAR